MAQTKIAVIGASGVVGRALLDRAAQKDLLVLGLSRRAPDLPGVTHIPLDLTDAEQCRQVVSGSLADATHVVYTALYEKPGLIAGWFDEDQMQTNLTMLQNLVEPLLETNKHLRNITLLQGTKAYGAHFKPMRIPGKEREPRVEHENFYWLQEDYLKGLQSNADFSLTIWRPQIIFGHALGAPMNMLSAIGVYGALCKHEGKPLSYPGGPSGVQEAIDADLLGDAILFSLDNDNFANETFNITNGDVYQWENVWHAVADALEMAVGEPEIQFLSQTCYDEAGWRSIVDAHGLAAHTVKALVGDSFYYADALFNTGGDVAPPPALVSTIKLRQAGFEGCIDTEDMLKSWFTRLRHMKILP